jgi:hypothetical protein
MSSVNRMAWTSTQLPPEDRATDRSPSPAHGTAPEPPQLIDGSARSQAINPQRVLGRPKAGNSVSLTNPVISRIRLPEIRRTWIDMADSVWPSRS